MKSKIFFSLICCSITMGAIAQSNTTGPGLSMKFDGDVNSYVDIGDVYNTLNFPVTFEAWLYPTAYSTISGVVASDNDNVGNYYGFHVNMYITGNIDFQIGDGTGAGYTDRRGKKTTSVINLNTWTHVAIVATSITDIKFYFNGILQPSVTNDGTSPATNMVHSSKIGTIGRTTSVHGPSPFTGEMEDVRLWNVSRTEAEVRSNMCHKLLGSEPGLIGYWKADGLYADVTVEDITSPAENGTLTGTASKVTSSAPIGDVSVYQYAADWSGVALSLTSPLDDKLKVNKILNTPAGVHVYRVDAQPYYAGGLDIATEYYYGVFTLNGVTPAKYTATYLYSMGNGALTPENESNAGLFAKNDASKLNWSDAGATLNVTADKLTKKNSSSRKEFIFNTSDPVVPRLMDDTKGIEIYPNPADDFIIVKNVNAGDVIMLFDMLGNILSSNTCEYDNMLIDVSYIPAGVYIISTQTNNSNLSKTLILN